MAKTRKPTECINGSYSAIPHKLIDSKSFIGTSDRGKSLLYALMRQHNGSNNGKLQLTNKWLAPRGWPSSSSNHKVRIELIERGLIIVTRLGGLNSGPNWYAVTWLPITNYVGLDISACDFHQGAWGNCELQPTARRRPPQNCAKPSGYRNDAVPTTGTVKRLMSPTTGTKAALLNASAIPTIGNNVLPPLCLSKVTKRSKRIVGKPGCSGIPKELHRSAEEIA